MAAPPPYYPGGFASPPPAFGFTPGFSYPERPPKEHCFYIKSNVSGLVMEVENAGVDPGTRVVMVPKSDQGKDSELWFEDYQTGTIKSRLNLLCLDTQALSQQYQVVKSPQSVPANALCPTVVGGRIHYSALAHTQWGTIPGRAVPNQCWYSYGGAEYCTPDFSWITAPNTRLVRNTGLTPAGAIGAGHQLDDGCTYYAAIAHSQWGGIPGKAKDNTCWYAYNGSEHYTSDFDWIVIEVEFVVVNPYAPGKLTQLWVRAGDKLQNRQDGTKVLEVCSAAKGSQVLSTIATNDNKQKWTFVNHVTSATKPAIPRYFYIQSELHGKVLDVAGENKQAGTMAIMWPKKSPPADNQLWYLDDNGIIRSKLTDFCLQPSGHGIWLQPFTKQANQMWTPEGKKIVLRNNPGICLDIHGGDKKDGAKLCQFKYKASANQHWKLVYIS